MSKKIPAIILLKIVFETGFEKMKKIFALLLGCVCLWAQNAAAQTAEDIKKVENYLNNIKTMEARFVQTASNGNTSEGKIYIAKPNKIRMEYNDPVNVSIVGDGNFIVYHDKELDQVTHIDYDDVPASLILANDIKIDGKKIKITDFYKDSGTTEAVVEYEVNGETHPITLVFNNNPFELKQWKITDPQGIEISVFLYNMEQDKDLDETLFTVKEKQSPVRKKNRR